MRTVIILAALFLAGCHGSDPIQPADYLAASQACEPHRGLVSAKVIRMDKAAEITAQCANGVVIDYLKPAKPPAPASKTSLPWKT